MESATALTSPSIDINGVLLSADTQYSGKMRIWNNVQSHTKI